MRGADKGGASVETLPAYKKCFFCGPATGGLALEVRYAGGKAFCDFTAHERFQGYDGMLHGGIVAGVLDEVMWWTLFAQTKAVTATWKLEVEFRRPIVCGETYRASGEVTGPARGGYTLSGVIEDRQGRACARATGLFRKTKGFRMEDVVKLLDFRGVSGEMRALFGINSVPGPGT